MRSGRHILKKIIRLPRRGSSASTSTSDLAAVTSEDRAHSDTVNAAVQREIEQSNELWNQGSKVMAFQVLRRARLKLGLIVDLQFEYGKRAVEVGQLWAAREALQDAIELDGAHLRAIELFLELNHIHPAAEGSATEVVTNLAKLIPYSSEFDVEAATILLPSMAMIEIVDQKIRMLRYSDSRIARHIGVLATSQSSEWSPTRTNQSMEESVARLIVLLSRSEYDLASPILDGMLPELRPRRALRLAVRKELRNKNFLEARMLLEYYRDINPEDKWSQEQLTRIPDAPNSLSTSQIISRGFPFPEKNTGSSYEPKRNRILYLLHSSLPYHSMGYATRTHGLLRGIRNHGWDVHGVTRLGYPYDMPQMQSLGPIAPATTIDGVPYHRLSSTEGIEEKRPIQEYISRYVAALKALASEHKPFVLHAASNHWNGLAGVVAARELGIPSIYEVRGLWEITRGSRNPEWIGGNMYKYMVRLETDAAVQADKVITITNALRQELIHRGVDSDKIVVVPNGVDPRRFGPRKKNDKLARSLGLENKVVVGYVGSILNYEGIDHLLDAAATLKVERSDVAFIFVGDGAELEEYQKRVATEKLDDIVKFTGRVPHESVEEYYSIIDICPFPRLPLPVCEIVSPLKPFEAMAMGKAVVASDVAALAEIVSDGENGLLFRKGDPDDLTKVIRRLLNDPKLRTELAGSGRAWVETKRDWSNLSAQVSDIYSDLLA